MGLKNIPASPKGTDNFIAACVSFSYVAQSLVGSEYKIENWRIAFTDSVYKSTDSSTVKILFNMESRLLNSNCLDKKR